MIALHAGLALAGYDFKSIQSWLTGILNKCRGRIFVDFCQATFGRLLSGIALGSDRLSDGADIQGLQRDKSPETEAGHLRISRGTLQLSKLSTLLSLVS